MDCALEASTRLLDDAMQPALSELQQRILRYLANRERAAETSLGVNSAWLLRSQSPANVAEVEEALEDLVARGLMSRHQMPGGDPVYVRASK